MEYWTTSNINIWTSAIYIVSVCLLSVQIQGYIALLFSIEIIEKYLLLYNNTLYYILELDFF